MVDKVETTMDHPMYGDEHVVRTYEYYEYRDGIQFPAHMVETITTPALTGSKALGLELFVTKVTPNAKMDFPYRKASRETPAAPAATSDDAETWRWILVSRRAERLQSGRRVQGLRHAGRRSAE